MPDKNDFHLSLEINNDAFGDDPRQELARLLRFAAKKVEDGADTFMLRDINGNTVGSAAFSIFE